MTHSAHDAPERRCTILPRRCSRNDWNRGENANGWTAAAVWSAVGWMLADPNAPGVTPTTRARIAAALGAAS